MKTRRRNRKRETENKMVEFHDRRFTNHEGGEMEVKSVDKEVLKEPHNKTSEVKFERIPNKTILENLLPYYLANLQTVLHI